MPFFLSVINKGFRLPSELFSFLVKEVLKGSKTKLNKIKRKFKIFLFLAIAFEIQCRFRT